ncbi:hypothetical protein ACFSNO_07525 [Streptomyces cirratus]
MHAARGCLDDRGEPPPVVSPSFAGFMAHFLAIAVARSLVSGASSAYLYEYLHEHGADAHYVQAEAPPGRSASGRRSLAGRWSAS